MKKLFRALVSILLVAAAQGAAAQDYPNRPIRLIVPFGAGGSLDLVARVVAQKMGDALGANVVVDNRGGGGGNIGGELAAKAAPDGYTLFMGSATTLAINVTLFKKIPYDPLKDFTGISLVAEVPLILMVNPSSGISSTQELLALIRSRPGGFNYASGGYGSSTHLSMEMFKSMAKLDLAHVPFNGSPPAVNALMRGDVIALIDLLPSSVGQVKAGKLKALAISTSKRSALVPELPTISESGVPGFSVTSWFGMNAPAGTPTPIVERLNAEVAKALALPDVRERLAGFGAVPVRNSPAEFQAFIRSEIGKWAEVVKTSGAHVD
jgi:tripartite-type tricarboxylate transporter receptor subunit TctC